MEQKQNLINRERTWKTVICLNPEHDTVKFETNDVGNIPCPTCKQLMIVEIKPRWELYETDKSNK